MHADGDDPLEVVVYSSESDWSDEEVVLNPTSDVELPLKSKSRFEGVEGAMTVATHRFATIEKGHRDSRQDNNIF